MKRQELKVIKTIHPYFDENKAKEAVQLKKKFSLSKKKIEWISSIPLYIPFWMIEVEMELSHLRKKEKITKKYLTMVNGITNRGMLVKGQLEFDDIETTGIFFDPEAKMKDVKETARLEALFNTKRLINPPPHKVLSNEQLVYYPLALVKLKINGQEEIQVFDYYRGGIDRFMMRYLKLKEKVEIKKNMVSA